MRLTPLAKIFIGLGHAISNQNLDCKMLNQNTWLTFKNKINCI